MAIRFQKWPILEFLGITEKDYDIYAKINKLLFVEGVKFRFWMTKEQVLSFFPEEERERAEIILDAFSDVQLIQRRYDVLNDKDIRGLKPNTPCYSLYTAAELEAIHGHCDDSDLEIAPKELLTDD